jgi:hypothetical protein
LPIILSLSVSNYLPVILSLSVSLYLPIILSLSVSIYLPVILSLSVSIYLPVRQICLSAYICLSDSSACLNDVTHAVAY